MLAFESAPGRAFYFLLSTAVRSQRWRAWPFLGRNCLCVLTGLCGRQCGWRSSSKPTAGQHRVALHWSFGAETSLSKSPESAEQRWGIGTGAQAQKRTPEETGRPEAQAAWAVNSAPAKGKCSRLSELLGSGIPRVQWENRPCLRPTPSFRPNHKISPLFS